MRQSKRGNRQEKKNSEDQDPGEGPAWCVRETVRRLVWLAQFGEEVSTS